MSNQYKREGEASAYDAATDPNYQYRWSYAEQSAYEGRRARRKRRRGAVVYALTMAVAFLCCFAILFGVLATYGEWTPSLVGGASVADVAEAMLPCTVLISGTSEEGYSYGSGFFVREDGYIVTNYHVIDGQESICVTLYGKTEAMPAMLVGYSVADDLAVLRIQGGGYPTLVKGSSDALRVGDVAVAVGNPTGPGGAWTTTSGIISAVDRTVSVTSNGMIVDMRMLQTDAALNSGNSGGPLCNDRGELIGIVTRKYNDTEGISLAIPIDGAMPLISAIIQRGDVGGIVSTVSRSRPMLGIQGQSVEAGESFTVPSSSSYASKPKTYVAARDGVAVLTVDLSIPAAKNLRAGDVIYAVDGIRCTTVEALAELLYQYEIGDQVELSVSRNATDMTIVCRFAEP